MREFGVLVCIYPLDCSTLASRGEPPVGGLSECFCLCGLPAHLARSGRKQIEVLTKPFTAFVGQTVPLETTRAQAGKAKLGFMCDYVPCEISI